MVSNKVSITLILFFCINLISTNIYASNVGGWTLGGGIAQGASTVYNGTKQVIIDGKDYIKKGTAIITPTATGVAKTLAKGVAGVALSVAVEQLLGAVDWVLDPENNRIKYFEPNTADPPHLFHSFVNDKIVSARTACTGFGNSQKPDPWKSFTFKITGDLKKGYYCDFSITYSWGDKENQKILLTPAVIKPEAEREEKYLPLPTVAQKVISNAENGDTNAQVATTAAAADMVAEAEKDDAKARPIAQQLEANATTKPADEAAADKANEATGEQTKNPDKPDTTDLKLTFPIFCNWAPTVCEAAQTVISFPKTLTNWWETGKEKAEGWATSISESWTAVKDWVKEEPSKDDQVEIQEKQPEQKTVDLNFGSACPAPVVLIDSTFYDQPFKIEYSFNDFCSILSDFVRPVLIAMGAFIAALILGGVKTNE